MSKTYKTDPYQNYLADPKKHGIQIREYHNHENGVCELNPNPLKSSWRDSCHYDIVLTGKSICGCRLCTGYWWKKWERKKERLDGKQYARGKYVEEY